jgi:hypothetical protein
LLCSRSPEWLLYMCVRHVVPPKPRSGRAGRHPLVVTGSTTRGRRAGRRSSAGVHEAVALRAGGASMDRSLVWRPVASRFPVNSARPRRGSYARPVDRRVDRSQRPAVARRCSSVVGGATLCVVHSSAKAFHLRSALKLTHQPRTAPLTSSPRQPATRYRPPTSRRSRSNTKSARNPAPAVLLRTQVRSRAPTHPLRMAPAVRLRRVRHALLLRQQVQQRPQHPPSATHNAQATRQESV